MPLLLRTVTQATGPVAKIGGSAPGEVGEGVSMFGVGSGASADGVGGGETGGVNGWPGSASGMKSPIAP